MKKCGLLKIVHEKYRSSLVKPHPAILEFRQTLQAVTEGNREIQTHINKAQVCRAQASVPVRICIII